MHPISGAKKTISEILSMVSRTDSHLDDWIHPSGTTARSWPYASTKSLPSCYKYLPHSLTYTTHSLSVYIFINNNELLPYNTFQSHLYLVSFFRVMEMIRYPSFKIEECRVYVSKQDLYFWIIIYTTYIEWSEDVLHKLHSLFANVTCVQSVTHLLLLAVYHQVALVLQIHGEGSTYCIFQTRWIWICTATWDHLL